MEVAAVGLNGLVTPFFPSSKKPSQSQDHPPQRAGHAKIVEDQEDQGTSGALQTFLDDIELATVSVTGNALGTGEEADDVSHRVDTIAHGEEDDGPFGVLEALGVDQERKDGEGAGEEAEDGPDGDPDDGKLLVGGAPVDIDPWGAKWGTGSTLLHMVELTGVLTGGPS